MKVEWQLLNSDLESHGCDTPSRAAKRAREKENSEPGPQAKRRSTTSAPRDKIKIAASNYNYKEVCEYIGVYQIQSLFRNRILCSQKISL